jgi:Tfp pilus assembly protein PilF
MRVSPTLFPTALARLAQDATLPVEQVERLRAGTATVEEWCNAGEKLLGIDPRLARALLERAAQLQPNIPNVHYLLGNALRMLGQAQVAEASLRKAIALRPAHADASLSLAFLLREQGRMQALADVMLDLWRNEPRSLDSDRRTLAFLCECGRFGEARQILPAMLEAHPHEAELLRRAGEIALVLGHFDAARDHLNASLDRDPHQASAWLRLAHTHRFASEQEPDLIRLRQAATRVDLGADAQSAVGFALGKALDDLDQIEEASRVLGEANARWRASHPWNAAPFLAQVDQPPQPSRAESAEPAHSASALFIVGLPRAGTTLLETLLCRDPALRSRGELNWIDALARKLGPQPSTAMLQSAGEFYLAQLRQDDAPASIYIDKNPLNFRYLGLIAAMLPRARIIHCRRDIRATALSLWSQHFAHESMAWSYSFEDIARFAHGYQQLMAHWLATAPLPIHELDYESLAREPESVIAGVRNFLDLGADESPSTSKSAAAIATASVWQARQQVHTRSVERWRRYEPFLPQLADMQAVVSPSPAGVPKRA